MVDSCTIIIGFLMKIANAKSSYELTTAVKRE